MAHIIFFALAAVWGVCLGVYRSGNAPLRRRVRTDGVWECHRLPSNQRPEKVKIAIKN